MARAIRVTIASKATTLASAIKPPMRMSCSTGDLLSARIVAVAVAAGQPVNPRVERRKTAPLRETAPLQSG
jgi:hypothetical protein